MGGVEGLAVGLVAVVVLGRHEERLAIQVGTGQVSNIGFMNTLVMKRRKMKATAKSEGI